MKGDPLWRNFFLFFSFDDMSSILPGAAGEIAHNTTQPAAAAAAEDDEELSSGFLLLDAVTRIPHNSFLPPPPPALPHLEKYSQPGEFKMPLANVASEANFAGVLSASATELQQISTS